MLYLMVSRDEYELPLGVFDTPEELAEFAGVTVRTIRKEIWKNRNTNRFSRFRAVPDEGEAPPAKETKAKPTCRNCAHCTASYKGGYCELKGRRIKYAGTCPDHRRKGK